MKFVSKFAQHDYIFYSATEYFSFSTTSENLRKVLELLTHKYDFDVVHFHHYIHVGIEGPAVMKQIKPSVRVVLTLHEYLGICANNGQLFKKSGEVCEDPRPKACTACFPQRTEADFFMRKLRIQAAFTMVDAFISPSLFLREKYIEWGIAPEKIVAIENPLFTSPTRVRDEKRPRKNNQGWRLGFFGQINYYKGLDIILNGVELALKNGCGIELNVHGKLSAVTGEAYIEDLKGKISLLSNNVLFHGPYDQSDVLRLMGQYDFVIMGSRWYENSPVVIQEAFSAGTPIIYPAHGGMLEKVGKLGIGYKPGSADDLSEKVSKITPQMYELLVRRVEGHNKSLNSSINLAYVGIRELYES